MPEPRIVVAPRPVIPPKPVVFWERAGGPTAPGLLLAWRCQETPSGVGGPQWYGLVLTGAWRVDEWTAGARWMWAAHLRPWSE